MSHIADRLPAPIVDAKYPFDDPKADVILRSSDKVDFRCYKLLLAFASPSFFEGMFNLPQPTDDNSMGETKDGLPIIPVTEERQVLENLLRLCYPSTVVNPPALLALEDVRAVLEATIKYGMDKLEQRVRKVLVAPRFIENEPMRVFGIACRFRLEREARIAAKYTLRHEVRQFPYVAELEDMTGGDHHRLLEYHAECASAAKTVADNPTWIELDSFVWFQCTSASHNDAGYFVTISGGRELTTQCWWWDPYMVPASDALECKPCGKTVRESSLVEDALKSSRFCPECGEKSYTEIRAFSELFAKEVENVVSEVKLNLRWAQPQNPEPQAGQAVVNVN